MLNYNLVIIGDMFRPLNGHPQANLEQCCSGTVKIVIQWDPIVYFETWYVMEFLVMNKTFKTVWKNDKY